MRIFNKFRGTKGFLSLWERVIRFRDMISEQAKERVRILAFWEKHGDEATKEAFDTSPRTLFRWASALKKQGGKLEALNPGDRAPKGRRRRNTPEVLAGRIVTLRTEHPRGLPGLAEGPVFGHRFALSARGLRKQEKPVRGGQKSVGRDRGFPQERIVVLEPAGEGIAPPRRFYYLLRL